MGMGMHDDVIEDLTVSIIKEEDAVQMIELQMRLADETVFLLRALDEVEIDAEKQRDEIRKNRNDVSSFLFGAYIKGKLVGFLSGSRGKFSRNQHVAHLAIGVLEAYWGKGVAKRLMTSFITWAKEVDISRIEMEVVEDNQRALAFCYHFGFKIEGKKESDHFVKEDKYLNTYVLGKIIDRKIITD
ncbi:MAG: GNAT family N-acetyltransferase [Clostridia bacterium]|nr:GNAT family N-acetyltransferase [Clostridia bacterium]